MTPSEKLLKKFQDFKAKGLFDANHDTRLYRGISWLRSAEKHKNDEDMRFISLWVGFNALYANYSEVALCERDNFRAFITQLVDFDTENRFFNLLWNTYSGSIRLILDNKFVFEPFWNYQRGSISEMRWKEMFKQQNEQAARYLAMQDVVPLTMVILDRLYVLRNTLIHGGSSFGSSVNRSQLKDACNIMNSLLPVLIDIMLEHRDGWGTILYPVVKD